MALAPTDLKDLRVLLATGFGSGFLPKAPGTWGSVVGFAVWFALPHTWAWQAGACVVGLVLGTLIVDQVCRRHAVDDAPEIVLDEIIGVWIALLGVPADTVWVVVAFVLFRLFDIVKPWPVGWAERRFKGGVGVMADDVLAGLLAFGVLNLSVLLTRAF